MQPTPLARHTPLRRTSIKRKRRRGDDVQARLDYLETHSNCGICHANWRAVLSVHHLVGGSGRKDVEANFLTTCMECHDEYHRGDTLTPGMMLTAKMEQDPDNYGESVILKLLGRNSLPERWKPSPLPAWALETRKKR